MIRVRIIVSILQVGKLRPTLVKGLARITQLERAELGIEPGSPEASARTLPSVKGSKAVAGAPSPQHSPWAAHLPAAVGGTSSPGRSSSCPFPNHRPALQLWPPLGQCEAKSHKRVSGCHQPLPGQRRPRGGWMAGGNPSSVPGRLWPSAKLKTCWTQDPLL